MARLALCLLLALAALAIVFGASIDSDDELTELRLRRAAPKKGGPEEKSQAGEKGKSSKASEKSKGKDKGKSKGGKGGDADQGGADQGKAALKGKHGGSQSAAKGTKTQSGSRDKHYQLFGYNYKPVKTCQNADFSKLNYCCRREAGEFFADQTVRSCSGFSMSFFNRDRDEIKSPLTSFIMNKYVDPKNGAIINYNSAAIARELGPQACMVDCIFRRYDLVVRTPTTTGPPGAFTQAPVPQNSSFKGIDFVATKNFLMTTAMKDWKVRVGEAADQCMGLVLGGMSARSINNPIARVKCSLEPIFYMQCLRNQLAQKCTAQQSETYAFCTDSRQMLPQCNAIVSGAAAVGKTTGGTTIDSQNTGTTLNSGNTGTTQNLYTGTTGTTSGQNGYTGTTVDTRYTGTTQNLNTGTTLTQNGNTGTTQNLYTGTTSAQNGYTGTTVDTRYTGTTQNLNTGTTLTQNGNTGTTQNLNTGTTLTQNGNTGTTIDSRNTGTTQNLNTGTTLTQNGNTGTTQNLNTGSTLTAGTETTTGTTTTLLG